MGIYASIYPMYVSPLNLGDFSHFFFNYSEINLWGFSSFAQNEAPKVNVLMQARLAVELSLFLFIVTIILM